MNLSFPDSGSKVNGLGQPFHLIEVRAFGNSPSKGWRGKSGGLGGDPKQRPGERVFRKIEAAGRRGDVECTEVRATKRAACDLRHWHGNHT